MLHLLVFLLLVLVSSSLRVISPITSTQIIPHYFSHIGPWHIAHYPLVGPAVLLDPIHACTSVRPPPLPTPVCLALRGKCVVFQKISVAARAGCRALVLIDRPHTANGTLVCGGPSAPPPVAPVLPEPLPAHALSIPSYLIPYCDGRALADLIFTAAAVGEAVALASPSTGFAFA